MCSPGSHTLRDAYYQRLLANLDGAGCINGFVHGLQYGSAGHIRSNCFLQTGLPSSMADAVESHSLVVLAGLSQVKPCLAHCTSAYKL